MPRSRRSRAFAAVLVGIASTCPLIASAQARARSTTVAAIDSVVASYLKDGRAAGMSVAIVKGRDTLVLKGYGKADLELDVPTPARAVYEIGSVTKQFTASAILMLQEEGKLSLDDDISKYLPDYPTQGHRISVRQLLNHTSGIKGYTEIPKFGAIMTRHLPKDSLVALFKDEKFDFAPGVAMVYNNSAYFLAGLIIEKVSGQSYADFVKQHLFDRVGMTDSRYCSESEITPRKAHGYDMGPKGLQIKGFMDHTYPYSAGSLCSTVGDLLAWNRALHGGKVLSAASYAQLTGPSTLNDGTKLRYGLGIAMHDFGGHRVIEHGGGINGYLSESSYFPDQDAVIIVLINSAGPVSPNAVVTSLANVLFGPVMPPAKPFGGDLAALVGKFSGVGRGAPMTVTVAVTNGALRATYAGADKPIPLRFVGDDTWDADGSLLTFAREGGKVTTLRVDQAYGYSYLTRQP